MPYVTIEEEVWIDLDEFETDDLVEELQSRGVNAFGPHGSTAQIINTMYDHQAMGKDIEPLLRELYYTALGKIA